MKAVDFEKIARYDYWICKDVDDRGELIHIRFVDYYGSNTGAILKQNGYVSCFSGCRAEGYCLPNYRKVLVKKSLSSEGPEGTIIATRKRDVFDETGEKIGQIWDTRHCGIGGLDYALIDEPENWMRVIYLEDKYVEFFENLKETRYKNGYLTEMTYQDVRAIVDDGLAEKMLEELNAKE